MKAALLAFVTLVTWPAHAAATDPVDDYAACLIGHAAVALHKQTAAGPDVDKALEVAYETCASPPEGAFDEEAGSDGVDDMVLFTVEKIAGARSKGWVKIGG